MFEDCPYCGCDEIIKQNETNNDYCRSCGKIVSNDINFLIEDNTELKQDIEDLRKEISKNENPYCNQ